MKCYLIFFYSGISNSLDGSQDDQFRGYEDIKNDYEIIQIKYGDLYLDDYVASIDSDEL